MTIGKKIRKYRKEKGLTQKRLAELSELATITIQQYEANKYKPKLESLQRIANVLNIDVNVLLEYEKKHIKSLVFTAKQKHIIYIQPRQLKSLKKR